MSHSNSEDQENKINEHKQPNITLLSHFVTKDTRNLNKNNVGQNLSVRCEICEKLFSRISYLNAHLRTHTKDFYCYVCCNSYITKFKLDQHLLQHPKDELLLRKNNPNSVQCQCGCSETFPSKLQLHEHKKQLRNIVEHTCDSCNKKFRNKKQLSTHLKQHERLLSCNVCGKHYSNNKILTQHLRLHSDERPYTCSVCNATFRYQSGLKAHETIHSGQRNYKCGQCNKTFARSNYLKQHMWIHFDMKPFQCEFCSQTFRQKNVLKTHLATKHRCCSKCSLPVGDSLQLRMHIWKCHTDELHSVDSTFDVNF